MKFLVVILVSLLSYAKNIDYKIAGNNYEGYILKNGNKPVVMIIHDWDGLTEYEVKRANMLKDLGFSVFAVDMYGKGNRPKEIEDRKKMTKSLYDDREKMRKLMNGALLEIKKQGLNSKKVIVLGYCFGGTSALEFARSGAEVAAIVSFHGGLETPEGQNYKNIKTPIYIFHGTADTSVTMDQFASIAKEMEANKVAHEMISYSGAPHAFSVIGGDRYREDADRKSWKRLVEIISNEI